MNKVKNILKKQTTDQLCESYELTNTENGGEIPMVRGWIMDELEERNPENFMNWIETDDIEKMDFPSLFFK